MKINKVIGLLITIFGIGLYIFNFANIIYKQLIDVFLMPTSIVLIIVGLLIIILDIK